MRNDKARRLLSEHHDRAGSHRGDRDRTEGRNDTFQSTDWYSGRTSYDSYNDTNSNNRFQRTSNLTAHYHSPFLQPQLVRSQKDVKVVLKKELANWGIDIRNPDHEIFSRAAITEAIDCFTGRIQSWTPPNISTDVPHNISDAIQVLLRVFLKRMTNNGDRLIFTKARDLIEDDFDVRIPYPPFSGQSTDRIRRRNGEYRNMPLEPAHLDPLQRFSFYDVDAESSLREEWKGQYHIVEATAIHKIIHGGHACLKCEECSSFRLNSNLNVSFSDIICMSCKSMYTVWNIKDEEALFKRIQKGQVNKGRFYVDFLEEQRNLSPGAGMFAAFVCAETLKSSMPVYVASLDSVSPNLTSRSFNTEKIRIFSNVSVRLVDYEPWFHCSISISPKEMQALSMSAIDQFFSELSGIPFDQSDQAHIEDTPVSIEYEEQELRTQVRQLRRKRNQIESLRKRIDNGERLEPDDVAIVNEEEFVLAELETLEGLLRKS